MRQKEGKEEEENELSSFRSLLLNTRGAPSRARRPPRQRSGPRRGKASLWGAFLIPFVSHKSRKKKDGKIEEKERKKNALLPPLTSQGPQQRPEPPDVGPGLHGPGGGPGAGGGRGHRPRGVRERRRGRGGAGDGASRRGRGGGGRRRGVAGERGAVVREPRRRRRGALHPLEGLPQGAAQRVDDLELPGHEAVPQRVRFIVVVAGVAFFSSSFFCADFLFVDGRQGEAVAAARGSSSSSSSSRGGGGGAEALPRVLFFLLVEAGAAEGLAERASVVGGVGEGLVGEGVERERRGEEAEAEVEKEESEVL